MTKDEGGVIFNVHRYSIHDPAGIIPPDDEYIESLRTTLESRGLTVMIGG